MLHGVRRFSVIDVATSEELAVRLTSHTWCACTGFRLLGTDLLFLNDSTGPDAVQEYAVVLETTRQQIESITFGWCNRETALGYIDALVAGRIGRPSGAGIINPIESAENHGRCAHCA